jgi:hypothetical protein
MSKLELGDNVIDFNGHKGIVVNIIPGTSDENHGMIAVWQSERTGHGDDNCEHYVEFGWERVLTKTSTEDDIINQAIKFAVMYGGIDGAHHKDWVIDQMVRILAGTNYKQIVKDACAGEDGPNTYSWDVGIPP